MGRSNHWWKFKSSKLSSQCYYGHRKEKQSKDRFQFLWLLTSVDISHDGDSNVGDLMIVVSVFIGHQHLKLGTKTFCHQHPSPTSLLLLMIHESWNGLFIEPSNSENGLDELRNCWSEKDCRCLLLKENIFYINLNDCVAFNERILLEQW